MFGVFGAPFVTVSKGHCRNDSICSLVSAKRWNYKNSLSESLKLCPNRLNYSQIAETNFAETNFAESKKWQNLKISGNWRTSTNFPAKTHACTCLGHFTATPCITAYLSSCACRNWRTSGTRVWIPSPRGKSTPQSASNDEVILPWNWSPAMTMRVELMDVSWYVKAWTQSFKSINGRICCSL